MRTVSSPTAVELAKPDTQPRYLVQISFDSGVNRFCTHSDVVWDSFTWTGKGMRVEPPSDSSPTGRIEIPDEDWQIHALIFGGAFKSRAVDIWMFYGAALADADPVHVASCITAGAESSQGRCVIQLQRLQGTLLQCPREIIGPSIGCNFLAPPGTQIAWGGKILTLESADG